MASGYRFNRSFFATGNSLTNLHTISSKNVVIRAVVVFDTSNTCRTVWVIFDVLDSSG